MTPRPNRGQRYVPVQVRNGLNIYHTEPCRLNDMIMLRQTPQLVSRKSVAKTCSNSPGRGMSHDFRLALVCTDSISAICSTQTNKNHSKAVCILPAECRYRGARTDL